MIVLLMLLIDWLIDCDLLQVSTGIINQFNLRNVGRTRYKGGWSGYFVVETNQYELSRYAQAHPGRERERGEKEWEGGGA